MERFVGGYDNIASINGLCNVPYLEAASSDRGAIRSAETGGHLKIVVGRDRELYYALCIQMHGSVSQVC